MTFKKGISQEEAYLWGLAAWFSGDEKPESLKYNGSTKHLRVIGKGETKAMRLMPIGKNGQWQASFEIAD